jgi:hypothetical protein
VNLDVVLLRITYMKPRWLLVLLLLLSSVAWNWGADGLQPSEMKTKDVLHAVINGQLAAFRKDDYAAAFVFADKSFKEQLSLEQFERMVKSGFPAIAHSTSARCGLSFDDGDEAVVNVRVFSDGRDPLDYQYTLRRDGESWHITSVTLLKDHATEV